MDQTSIPSFDGRQDYKLFFENAPDAVVLIDQFNRIRFWNKKAESIFGWSSADVIGEAISDIIVPPAFRQAHIKGMERHLATGEARVLNKTIEVPALHRNGKEFHISLTISRIELRGLTGFLAFIRDVTQQKQNQAQLELKTKELERSNANLEEFAHAASHDLKEPVRKIHFFIDRLKSKLEDRLDGEERQLLERVGNATERMRHLIDDLLEYSHVSHITQEMEAVNLNEKVKQVLQDLEIQILEKEASIAIDTLPVIKGHRRQLQQLFQNLISNALKYSKDGVIPEIHIKSHEVMGAEVPVNLPVGELNKQFHLIEVSDNGIGFNQEDADRIFQIFQRLHGKNEYSGTGVGLAIVRKVVENHGGYIWAESKPREGARFNVLLAAS